MQSRSLLPAPAIAILVPDAFDERGRRVRRLAGGPYRASIPMFTWDGRGGGGQIPPTGVRLARLRPAGVATTNMLLLE
jgi:hypothetical protein